MVAAEVRSLAQRSAEAAREIKGLIGESVGRVESGVAIVNDAGRTMQGIVDSVNRLAGLIEEISSAATHLSSCEQRSVKAERAVISIKKARFIRRYVGEILEGSVTSIAKFGIFVTLREFEIDGLVKLESLGPDRWVFDDQNMRLYGRRTGRVFKLGDVLNVMVQSSDLATGKIDFSLEDEGTQVEEALVVLGDEMEVEELAERAEEMLSQKARGENRGKRGRSRAAKGAAKAAAGHAKPAKSPIKPVGKAAPGKPKKKSIGRRGGNRR